MYCLINLQPTAYRHVWKIQKKFVFTVYLKYRLKLSNQVLRYYVKITTKYLFQETNPACKNQKSIFIQ